MVFKSIGVFLCFLLISKLTHVNSLDFSEAKFDEISGELEKPFNWTQEQFNIYKQLRMTVSVVAFQSFAHFERRDAKYKSFKPHDF